MIEFITTMGGSEVRINGRRFGFLSRERGFFTDPTVIREFVEVSVADLRKLADEAESYRAGGTGDTGEEKQ